MTIEVSDIVPGSLTRSVVVPRFRGYISEFDGLRGIASIVVILCHFWPNGWLPLVRNLLQLGWIAMDSFFVLSGFLITGILIDSRARPDYYRTYYIRRSARIFPMYYAVLVMVTIAVTAFYHDNYLRTIAWFFIYLGNVRTAIAGVWPRLPVLHPLWSLQVEEQFYLLYPFLIRALREKALTRVLWMMVFISPTLRVALYFYNPANDFLQYVLLPSRMEGLALGGVIAIRYRQGPWAINRKWVTVAAVAVLAIAAVSGAWDGYSWWFPLNRTVGYFISSVGCALLILALVELRERPITACLRNVALVYLGRISYGTYLLQMPVLLGWLYLSRRLNWNMPTFAGVLAPVCLTIAAASLSWYAVEQPILSWGRRLR